MNAIVQGDTNTIKCFLEFGIDPNCCDYDRRTALHLAVSKKSSKVIEILVGVEADKDLNDRWDKSPADYARSDDYTKALELFQLTQNKSLLSADSPGINISRNLLDDQTNE